MSIYPESGFETENYRCILNQTELVLLRNAKREQGVTALLSGYYSPVGVDTGDFVTGGVLVRVLVLVGVPVSVGSVVLEGVKVGVSVGPGVGV